MTPDETTKDCKERMEKALDNLRNSLKGMRTGRASPALLDSIRVEYYGSPTPIKQIANVTAPEASEILIKPFQVGDLKEIEKAIRSSDLGLAPNNDGKVIRLKIPAMSGDQRKKMETQIKKTAEESKVSCRNIRRDGNKHYDQGEKDGVLTEDGLKVVKDDLQNLLKDYERRIDETASAKVKEVMEN